MFPQIVKPFKSMMQFFQPDSNMVSNPTDDQNNIDSKAPIYFSAKLIANLQAEHRQIVKLYREVAVSVQSSEFQAVPHQLRYLKREFYRHLMQEDLSFYSYIEQKLTDQSEQIKVVQSYRKEISSVSNRLNKFIDKWQGLLLNPQNMQQFQIEYNAMGDLLTLHFNHEEKHLYPLYQH